jgi:[protein-PII] uridylyltransferase
MHNTNYTDSELFNSEQFKIDLEKSKSEVTVFRDALTKGNELLKQRFDSQKNASNYIIQRTWLIDQILLQAQKYFCLIPELQKEKIALIAVGGYGRGELHPQSDVDLLILLDSSMSAAMQNCVERLIMFLWDIRLKIGHSVRTLEECSNEAAADITIATNLMEARFLAGDKSLFEAMQVAISPEKIWQHEEFFAAKIKEQKQRHLKYHDTGYNLEPNIKESPGGLRDIQMIGWVAKRYFGATTLRDLVRHGFLNEQEFNILFKAQEFLWEIRCILHLISGRSEDRLSFDYQKQIASILNYQDDEKGLAVEKFMKRYYCTVKEISTLNDMLLQLFREAILYADISAKVTRLNKRFQIRNNFIEVTHDKVFLHYPFALLEIFLLIQEHSEIKGIRAATIRLILHYKYLIDEIFQKDLRARSLFMEIFRQPRGLTHVLRRMNRYGILAAYLPEFDKIVGQMQFDLFHVYTVDQHTLFLIRNLRRLNVAEHAHELPLCSELIKSIPKPELLYIAGLFHDIAKGRGGDHSKLGEKDAWNFCLRHDLSNEDARLVAWLVRNHLLMSSFAQRQDLSDPTAIQNFAMQIEDTVHLDYLYLLTVADIRATNSTLWNNWKDSLLKELYNKTRKFFSKNNADLFDQKAYVKEIQNQVRSLLKNNPTDLWQKLGNEYFLSSSPEAIAHETEILLKHMDFNTPIVLKRHEDSKSGTKFIIFTPDHDALFAKISHFLEQQNLNIVDADIMQTDSEYAISIYTVLEVDNTAITEQARIEEILQGLKQNIISNDNSSFDPINRHIPRKAKHFTIETEVTINQDQFHNHTIINVITHDRPGVLSNIAQAFMSCKVRLKKAKMATFGTKVEDVFFITDSKNNALYSAEKLDCLNSKIVKYLT